MDNVTMTAFLPAGSPHGVSAVCGSAMPIRSGSERLRPRTYAVQLDPEPSAPRRWDP